MRGEFNLAIQNGRDHYFWRYGVHYVYEDGPDGHSSLYRRVLTRGGAKYWEDIDPLPEWARRKFHEE